MKKPKDIIFAQYKNIFVTFMEFYSKTMFSALFSQQLFFFPFLLEMYVILQRRNGYLLIGYVWIQLTSEFENLSNINKSDGYLITGYIWVYLTDIQIRKSVQYKEIKRISNNWIYPDISDGYPDLKNPTNTKKSNGYLIIG